MMGSRRLPVALAVACALIAGCTLRQVKRYYTLANAAPADSGPVLEGRPCARSLVVVPVETAAPYDEEKIVFRTDAVEVKHFNYRLWIEPPPEMVAKLLSEKIEGLNLFGAVEGYIESATDHLVLSVKLLAIEEVASGRKKSARLAVRFRLRDPKTEAILWQHEFDTSAPTGGGDAPALVQTLSRIYNEEVDAVMGDLAKAVSAYPGCGQ